MSEQLARVYRLGEDGIEAQDAVDPENVGNQVVGEGGETVLAAQRRDVPPVEVGRDRLSALEEGDRTAIVDRRVGERPPLGKEIGEVGADPPAASTTPMKRPS